MTLRPLPAGEDSVLTLRENSYGDRYCKEIVGNTFKSTSAASEYRKRYGDALFEENTLYVVIGSDCGLLPRYIIDHGTPRGSRYLFIEPDGLKERLGPAPIPEELSDRLKITDEMHWQSHARDLSLVNYTYSGKISHLRSVAAQIGLYPGYTEMAHHIVRDLNHHFWRFNTQFDAHIFINSQLANLAENRVPAIRLKECFSGKSAIVIAAGPSLDQQIPWIKKIRDKVVVIAVSRIAARLIETQLEPDIVVSVDPQFVSFTVSKRMLELSDKTLFINGYCTTPFLVAHWPHRNAFTGPRIPWYDKGFDNIGTIAPTVTNNAIKLACEFGCKQIILAGVDLCYNAEGHTHAQGTQERISGPLVGKIDFTVMTNAGSEAETNKGYYEAIKVITEQAQEAGKSGTQIINLSAAAAMMDGVEYQPAENITIQNPLEKPAWRILDALLGPDSSDARSDHYRSMLKLMNSSARDLSIIRRFCKEALKCNSKMESSINTPEYSLYKRRIDKIEERLDKKFWSIGSAAKEYNSVGFARIITADSGEEWSASELFDKTKTYYEEFLKGATLLYELVKDTKERLISRLEEESPTPDFERLFNQWQQDIEYGRAILWKNRHPELYNTLAPEIKGHIDSICNQHHDFIKNDTSVFERELQKYMSDANTFGRIIEKALSYLEKGDKPGLLRLSSGLTQRQEPLAIQSAKLLQGLIHEIDGNFAEASNCYQAIDEKISPEIDQIALERIVSYSMEQEDYQTTLAALKELSQRISSYKPICAKLMAFNGETEGAIETYTNYLEEHPHDLDTTLDLGRILIEMGAREAAESALEHIKGINPDHPGIKELTDKLGETST